MKKYRQEQILSKVLEDIFCDICKKSCRDSMDMNYEFLMVRAIWGYGSRKDGDTWNGDYCEECSNKIKKFIESLGGEINIKGEC